MNAAAAQRPDARLCLSRRTLRPVNRSTSLSLLSLAILVAAAPAQANPDNGPLLCAGPELIQFASIAGGEPSMPGTYQCSEEGITFTLRLDADGRFAQHMRAKELLFEREDGSRGTETSLSGRWRIENGNLHLFEQPVRSPRIGLIEARHDPSVELRVEIRTPDGTAARGLFVGAGEHVNVRSSLDDGLLLIPKGSGWEPGKRWIVRSGDELRLAAFSAVAGGPNSFQYVYEPSEIEPFHQQGMIAGEHGEIIVVPLGIGGAVLQRVGSPK